MCEPPDIYAHRYKDGAALESSNLDTSPRVSYFIFRFIATFAKQRGIPVLHDATRVVMSRKDKADSHAEAFRSKVSQSLVACCAALPCSDGTLQVMGNKSMRAVAKALKRPPATVFW